MNAPIPRQSEPQIPQGWSLVQTRDLDALTEALMPFALAREEMKRRGHGHPILPDWIWDRAVAAYKRSGGSQ